MIFIERVSKRKKSPFLLIVSIILMVVICILLMGNRRHSFKVQDETLEGRPVKIMTLKYSSRIETRSFKGVVYAAISSDLGFEISGDLIQLNVTPGEWVKKGDIIARLDPREVSANLREISATILKIKARFKSMKRKITIAEIGVMEEMLKNAQAKRLNAEAHLARTRLTAPFSGYIGEAYVRNDDQIQKKAPIVSLYDVASAEIQTIIPEEIITQMNQVERITCRLNAFPHLTFPVAIKEIKHQKELRRPSYLLRVIPEISNKEMFSPGMSTTLSIHINNGEVPIRNFTLPTYALIADEAGRSNVFCVDPKRMRVIKTPVTIGVFMGKEVEITSGLSEGDQVVIAGARFLSDNQKIRILYTSGGNPS